MKPKADGQPSPYWLCLFMLIAFLAAGTTTLGAWPITLDPIFSGLAWSIIFGVIVSTAFTLVVIPVVYYLIFGHSKIENIITFDNSPDFGIHAGITSRF